MAGVKKRKAGKAKSTQRRRASPAAGLPIAPRPKKDDALSAYADSIFPVIAVGASAGGLEAFVDLLGGIPPEPGVSFLFIQHGDHRVTSAVPQVLARATKLLVREVKDGEQLRRNTLHVVPPGAVVTLADGALRVNGDSHRAPMPIDALFRSLADDLGRRVIGVVLSGANSDGTLGSKAIKGEGGITFAQDDSAKINTMPRSAVAAGSIDFVMSPAEMAREIVRIARHAYVSGGDTPPHFPEADLLNVFRVLQGKHDVDFTLYKPATIERRIRRRMALHKIDVIGDYVKLLHGSPDEVDQLYSDILIRVTAFFRDTEVFETLKRDIIPQMIKERLGGDTALRIWVPGCATGEEVYSLAIALLEATTDDGFKCPFQIFGTDISDSAVEHARMGIYPENISADVSHERLRRFFSKVDGGYRVHKAVRDCCIFARQDLTKDPPFSKLDLVSCRNVLIYLGAMLQRRVMSIFHYALRPNGYLLLGSSETIGNFGDLFASVDRKHKVYQKKVSLIQRPAIEYVPTLPRERPERARNHEEAVNPANVFREADRVLLARFSPAGVLINDNMDILQFRGRTTTFLEPAPGTASFNLFNMAREGLLAELRTAIHAARKKDGVVRRDGVRVKANGHFINAAVEVIPFTGSARDRYFVVLFEELGPVEPPVKKKKGSRETSAEASEVRQVTRLKRELEATREYLQSIIEEQEAMNEELRSANEEIQSSNEELQSTNEELETAKEELQSGNEELTTLNEELENRNQELAQVNNDLVNLLTSVDIPIIMLDSGLRVRRFNPGAQRALNLIPSDVGRSIRDLKTSLLDSEIEEMIAAVIDNLETRELEVHDGGGKSYLLRIRPYKTTENKIEGAVLVLIDLDQLRGK
jgi:two-component system CheB/CheR fusion protein